MKARLIRAGNSRGAKIPRTVLEENHPGDEIEISIEAGAVVLRSVSNVRANWVKTFESLGVDDALWTELLGTAFDDEDWTWP